MPWRLSVVWLSLPVHVGCTGVQIEEPFRVLPLDGICRWANSMLRLLLSMVLLLLMMSVLLGDTAVD